MCKLCSICWVTYGYVAFPRSKGSVIIKPDADAVATALCAEASAQDTQISNMIKVSAM